MSVRATRDEFYLKFIILYIYICWLPAQQTRYNLRETLRPDTQYSVELVLTW